jgi:hypothetical protein
MEALELEFVEDLFRFALLLSGRRSSAFELVCDAAVEAELRCAQWREAEQRFHWALQRVWSEWHKSQGQPLPEIPPSAEDARDGGLRDFLMELAPKPRATAALELVSGLPESVVARVLEDQPREVLKWKKECAARLGEEGGVWRKSVRGWVLDEEEKLKLQKAVQARPRPRNRFERVLGALAVLTGAFVLCGWFAWEHWQESEEAKVQASLEQILAGADAWKNGEWKSFEGNAGELEDWLFLNGLEGAHFPARLLEVPPTAGRVIPWRDIRIAQVVSAQPGPVIWLVPAEAAGALSEALHSGAVRSGRWSGEWTREGAYLVLVASAKTGG